MPNNLESEINENGKLIIKKEAFRNIITHILRFGSNMLQKPQQAMGICIGKVSDDGNNIILINAIPLLHGEQVEEEFSEEIKKTIEEVEQQYTEKNINVYGWYHSHIGLGLFFSASDLRNQQYFQLKESPYDFGIVFDPTVIKKNTNFGFKVFQLSDKDPDGYTKKEYVIEKPNNLEFFKWVQKFVEDYHKKEPKLIKELNESKKKPSMDLSEIPTIPKTSEGDIFDEDIALEGLNSYLSNLERIIKGEFSPWMTDISNGSIEGSKKLKESTSLMKENVNIGFMKINRWFTKTTEDLTDNFKDSVNNYLNKRMTSEQNLMEFLFNTFVDLEEVQKEKINQNLKKIINKNQKEAVSITEKLNQIKELSNNLKDLSSKVNPNLESVKANSMSLSDGLNNQLNIDYNDFKNKILEYLEAIKGNLSKNEKAQGEILELLNNLEKMIITIRNL